MLSWLFTRVTKDKYTASLAAERAECKSQQFVRAVAGDDILRAQPVAAGDGSIQIAAGGIGV